MRRPCVFPALLNIAEGRSVLEHECKTNQLVAHKHIRAPQNSSRGFHEPKHKHRLDAHEHCRIHSRKCFEATLAKQSGCLVVYDADKRYREQCLDLGAEKVRVVDTSESSIESRESALPGATRGGPA